jgi:LacI family transcriptional regulator
MPQKPTVMLLIDPSRAYERALLKGIAHYAHLHGPWIFVREAPFWERPSRAALLRQLRTVDGIIMREGPFLKEILSHHIPAIVSNYATDHIPGVTNLVSDHEAIGRLAAQHLLERGFKHFAFCGYPDLFWSQQRFKGFEACLKQAGHQVDHYQPKLAHALPCEEERAHLLRWLRELPKPVGLMACIDERSQQVVEACQSEGINIPEQVAIVGVDNDEMICTLSNIPLSSVAINAEKGGFAAAAHLHSLMQKKGAKALSPIYIKPSHVVARTSSDLLLVDDPQVGKALRYIRENCKRFLYVEEVARAAGLSRRVLEKRFRSVLHLSVLEHLRHCRIELISAMLLESTMTISEISLATGFSDAAHIARYFRSQTGISPQEYRKRHQL